MKKRTKKMKMMKKKNIPLLPACCLCCGVATALALSSCKHVEDEPTLNKGYATYYRVPDPESMTAEDSAIVAAQQAEYELNAK
jgi:hypothetical protein